MSAIVSLRSVTKAFGDTTAVNDVSLDIEEGEFFALLGPSGCGKTTLLRMVSGFENTDIGPGHDRWRGHDGYTAKQAARKYGFSVLRRLPAT